MLLALTHVIPANLTRAEALHKSPILHKSRAVCTSGRPEPNVKLARRVLFPDPDYHAFYLTTGKSYRRGQIGAFDHSESI
jgi:hypothetical protein